MYDQYRTALRKLAEECEFGTITPILHDHLVFGIWDAKVRERLLRESKLTLEKTDEICRAAESTSQQPRLVEPPETSIHAVGKPVEDDKRPMKECYKCGRKHAFFKRELCPVFGKTCNRCQNITTSP